MNQARSLTVLERMHLSQAKHNDRVAYNYNSLLLDFCEGESS
jgi:hypothetical protein